MNKIFYFASAMALTLASCSNDDFEALAPETNDNSDSDVITLSASVESDSPSRASFTSAGKFFWTDGDKIAVYNTAGAFSTLTLSSGAGNASAEFTGEISGSTSKCAVYPASAAKSLVDNTLTVTLPASYTYTTMPTDFPADGIAAFNSADMPMVAKIATDGDTNLAFKNLGGLFCFKFNDVPAGTCKIVFTANMQINGEFSVDISASEPKITAAGTTTQANKEVTVNFTALASVSNVAVYIPVPCCSYVGFKVKMYDGSENVTRTLLSAKTHEIERCTARRFDDKGFKPYNGKDSYVVDLGLSVKWANCNVGASSASDYGTYYMWGNTTYISNCASSNCPAYNKPLATLQSEGRIDESNLLTPGYDAATANWGGNWRMPTQTEWAELQNSTNCTWTWTTQDGKNGYKVTSKKSGYESNSIFLPAAGSRNGTTTNSAGSSGNYWSSTAYNNSSRAYDLYFYSSYQNPADYFNRYIGFTVRPVTE